ncbi:MAG: DeoR/GlpR family DNA-binding transcription regulator [Oscillospiraceae bacterium]
MIKERRFELINTEIRKRGVVSIDELTDKLKISRSTIRRDIFELETQNMLKRVRGGAVGLPSSQGGPSEPPFLVRQDLFYAEKQRIAEAAHSLVCSNETLILDSGTTIHEFSKTLGNVDPLYVATNDLKSAMEIAQFPNIDLMVLGGTLRKKHYSLHGYFTDNMITQIHADKVFLGADAIDFNLGLMNFSTDEMQSKKRMIKASSQVIVLCDHSKFEQIAFVNICTFDDINVLITGKEISDESLKKLQNYNIKVITV